MIFDTSVTDTQLIARAMHDGILSLGAREHIKINIGEDSIELSNYAFQYTFNTDVCVRSIAPHLKAFNTTGAFYTDVQTINNLPPRIYARRRIQLRVNDNICGSLIYSNSLTMQIESECFEHHQAHVFVRDLEIYNNRLASLAGIELHDAKLVSILTHMSVPAHIILDEIESGQLCGLTLCDSLQQVVFGTPDGRGYYIIKSDYVSGCVRFDPGLRYKYEIGDYYPVGNWIVLKKE